ncbi:L-arabinose-binding periplasmic protein [Moorella thermoacetica]|uniref:L-arabinose-binding periplasmic protein n=1 Tax=Neomoorella thermoacetica TaxID=1525 RepID=A0AAC9MUH1_NEOTH|nr:substrate-binding domain-containing protein [Moorella thermoacetica]AOQ23639.1 L-arabinose-binding periplasmic protein precursor [Moorella thermoacetica]TYL13823.1 L-arabinose-binding periplasmic protein [Moorella thermoacetica]
MKSKIFFAIVVFILVGTLLAGCGSKQSPSSQQQSQQTQQTQQVQKKLKFGYICKALTNPWFIMEEYGLKKKAQELGAEVISVDANLKDEAFMSAMDNLIAQKVDGLAVVVTNQSMGPVVAKKAQDAGIPLITIDDEITGVPHVGMPTRQLGVDGGKELVRVAKERGFFDKGNNVMFLAIDTLTVPVVHERIEGYVDGFLQAMPDFPKEKILRPNAKDYFYEAALAATSAVINAHPEVTHWIIASGNDDAVAAAFKVLEERKFNFKNVLGIGIGGYELALNLFKKGGDEAKAFMDWGLYPDKEGEKAVELLYDNIVNKKPIPEKTFIGGKLVNFDNWQEFFPNGELRIKTDKK